MDTNEIISELRDWAVVQGPGSLAEILNVAADKIEELDERLAKVYGLTKKARESG